MTAETTISETERFRQAIKDAGLTPPATITADGKLHRFASNGTRGDDGGWYIFHPDEVPAGAYGCWRVGIKATWCAKTDTDLTSAERAAQRTRIAAMQAERERAEQQDQAEAASRASSIWHAATPAPEDHPYLVRKHVGAHGLRLDAQNRLIMPISVDNTLTSLQFISNGGEKHFLPGGLKRGGYYLLGTVDGAEHLNIVEGYATGAAVFEATGLPTVIALDAGNLMPVAEALRTAYPAILINVCGDHDVSEVGQTKGQEAADAVGGRLVIPKTPGMDWNDVAISEGLDAVREQILSGQRQIGAALEIPSSVSPDPWPVLNDAALHGLAGEVIRLIEEHTEADPVALLVSLLSEFGAMLNRGPHLLLDGSYHPLLFWPVTVGQSSKSRKGTAGRRVQHVLSHADPDWTRGTCKGTLSSGEGLAFAVRDAIYKEEPVKEHGRLTGETVSVCADPGIEDKRLFLVQSEFGAILRIMAREGNSLSGVLRDAWDGCTLAPMTKANRITATDPHIAIVGHVTKEELLRNLSDTDTSNGFGNRFAWFLVRRSKELPFPGMPDESALMTVAAKIGRSLRAARGSGALGFSDSFRAAWEAIYSDLSADRPGMVGALLGRSEAQVMRLAGIYACLDGMNTVDLVHLKAALAVWEHAESSTTLIFGDSLGDPVADVLLKAIRAQEEMTDTELSELFGRNLSAAKLGRAKQTLLTAGLIHSITLNTGGRPRIVWRAVTKETKK